MVDLKLEMGEKEHSLYRSYAEVKICSKLSTTTWDDSVNVSWESLTKFFNFFGYKEWSPIQFLKRSKFSRVEAFLFYQHFSECLVMDSRDGIKLVFDIKKLHEVRHKYDLIFLNLEKHNEVKRKLELAFYYPDVLEKTNFDASEFDLLIFPFW